MTTQRVNWHRIAEVLGVIGIIGSMVFVAMEIRQNTGAIRSSTIQSVAELSYDAAMRFTENPSLREAYIAARSGSLSDDQELILRNYYIALIRLHQIRFAQVKLGILEMEEAVVMGGRAGVYRQPSFVRTWSAIKSRYPEDFRQYLDEYILADENE